MSPQALAKLSLLCSLLALGLAGYGAVRVSPSGEGAAPVADAAFAAELAALRAEVDALRAAMARGTGGAPQARVAADGAAGSHGAPPAPPELRPGNLGDLDEALERQSGRVAACLVQLGDRALGQEALRVELRVDPQGSVRVGDMQPMPGLGAREIECLKGVVHTMPFPNMGSGPMIVWRALRVSGP